MTANPGWYPDPDGKGGQRYFDGSSWTDARIAPKKPFAWASVPIAGWIGLALLGIVIVVVFAVVASGGSRDSASYQYGREQVSPLAITFMKQGLQGGGLTSYVDRPLTRSSG